MSKSKKPARARKATTAELRERIRNSPDAPVGQRARDNPPPIEALSWLVTDVSRLSEFQQWSRKFLAARMAVHDAAEQLIPGYDRTNLEGGWERMLRQVARITKLSLADCEELLQEDEVGVLRWAADIKREDREELLEMLREVVRSMVLSPGVNAPPEAVIQVVPGGFRLWGGPRHELVGKPLDVLRELLTAPDHCRTREQIRDAVWSDDSPTFPEQAVSDAASHLRKALSAACRAAGVKKPGNPLPFTGRGKDLAYSLILPSNPDSSE